ncbi:MAG: hypothetical protein ACYS6W_14100 [Planctomycetota bacterium]|jgi:hypothetical protein
MRTRNLLAVTAGLICCVVVVLLSPSIQGGEKTYEIRPQVTLPEYRSDAARAIDAYERLMDRYMGLTERNLIMMGTGLTGVVKKLDSIDAKLTELSVRMARIERALGIEAPKRPVEQKAPLEGVHKPIHRKFSPPPVE